MRAAFKYWKRRKPLPDFEKAIDLHSYSTNTSFHNEIKTISLHNSENKIEYDFDYEKFGLIPPEKWKIYVIEKNTGLIYIQNPYTSLGQRYWAVRCLKDFSKKPYKLNIDPHGYLNENEDWWTASHENNSINASTLLKKLRWSTLGYHHDWDTKIYNEENHHQFPEDLDQMCKIIGSTLGFDNFVPQASIVNYYHMDSTLSPHTDHSEVNLDAPLISISFGQSAIFLIGGKSEDIEPSALYLHSGDIVVMSKESRLCYHAVPKITKAKVLPFEMDDIHNQKENDEISSVDNVQDDKFWAPFKNYLDNSRININVRQVLYSYQRSLDDR